MINDLQLMKTQIEIEKAEISSAINDLIKKQKDLINLHQQVNETLNRITLAFDVTMTEIADEINNINVQIRPFNK